MSTNNISKLFMILPSDYGKRVQKDGYTVPKGEYMTFCDERSALPYLAYSEVGAEEYAVFQINSEGIPPDLEPGYPLKILAEHIWVAQSPTFKPEHLRFLGVEKTTDKIVKIYLQWGRRWLGCRMLEWMDGHIDSMEGAKSEQGVGPYEVECFYYISPVEETKDIKAKGIRADSEEGGISLCDEINVVHHIVCNQTGLREYSLFKVKLDGIWGDIRPDETGRLTSKYQWIVRQEYIDPKYIEYLGHRYTCRHRLKIVESIMVKNLLMFGELWFGDRKSLGRMHKKLSHAA